jgi:hypothetical protein
VRPGNQPRDARSQPEYIWTTVRQPIDEDDPGEIAEGWFTVDDGYIVLRNGEQQIVARQVLPEDRDPASVARALLRETVTGPDFYGPIPYPKLGLVCRIGLGHCGQRGYSGASQDGAAVPTSASTRFGTKSPILGYQRE